MVEEGLERQAGGSEQGAGTSQGQPGKEAKWPWFQTSSYFFQSENTVKFWKFPKESRDWLGHVITRVYVGQHQPAQEIPELQMAQG